VGGDDEDVTISCDTMVALFSSHIIGDNVWLWRADHSKQHSNGNDLKLS
jgi:hypothetical protein